MLRIPIDFQEKVLCQAHSWRWLIPELNPALFARVGPIPKAGYADKVNVTPWGSEQENHGHTSMRRYGHTLSCTKQLPVTVESRVLPQMKFCVLWTTLRRRTDIDSPRLGRLRYYPKVLMPFEIF